MDMNMFYGILIPFVGTSAGAACVFFMKKDLNQWVQRLSLIHISEPTRQAEISYAVFCLKKKKEYRKEIARVFK